MRYFQRGVLYSALLAGIFFAYLTKAVNVMIAEAIGFSILAFIVFLAVYIAGKKRGNKFRKAVILIGLTALLSLVIALYSIPFAVNTFVTFTAGSFALIYREELLPNMPAFMYCWLGALMGFIVAFFVLPRMNLGDVARALSLLSLVVGFAVLFLLLGKRIQYRPFNRYPPHI